MTNLSDQDALPALLDATWNLYESTNDPAQKGKLAGQYQALSQQLAKLSDLIPDHTKQEYADAVAAIQQATTQIKAAQADMTKVAQAIGKVAQVIAALAKVAATAAAA